MAYRIKVVKGKAKLERIKRRYVVKSRPKLTMHRPDLKTVLEALWIDNKVRCPSHITCWNHNHGYNEGLDLFYVRGVKSYADRKYDARLQRRIRITQLRG